MNCETVYDGRRGRGFGEVGMPDSLYIRYGYLPYCEDLAQHVTELMWIEWKAKTGRVKPHQLAWHCAERARGALTLIAGEDFPASVEGFRAWYRTSGLLHRSI